MAYDRTTGIVTRPVNFHDIAKALGSSSGDLATLCTHSNIKKWAKYKPMAIGDMVGYTEAQAKAANYGLYVPYFTTYQQMVSAVNSGDYSKAVNYIAGKQPFDYMGISPVAPSTGHWARALDFDGYNAQATVPPIAFSVYAQNPVPFRMRPTFRIESVIKTNGIPVSDLGAVVDGSDYRILYYGFFVNHAFAQGGSAREMSPSDSSELDTAGVSRTMGGGIDWNRDSASSILTGGSACAFLTNMQSFTNTTPGIFIPMAFTKTQFDLAFATLKVYSHFDSIYPYAIHADGSVSIYWLLEDYNDYNILGSGCSLNVQSQTDVWIDTDAFTLPYPLPYNQNTGVAEGIVIKMTPDSGTGKVLVQYVSRPTWPANDYVMLDDDGDPIEFYVDILGGSILSGAAFPGSPYINTYGMAYLADDATQSVRIEATN